MQLDNKLHPENSEVELTKEQTKGIEDYLIPVKECLSGEASLPGKVITKTEAKTDLSERGKESVTKKSNRKTKGVKK